MFFFSFTEPQQHPLKSTELQTRQICWTFSALMKTVFKEKQQHGSAERNHHHVRSVGARDQLWVSVSACRFRPVLACLAGGGSSQTPREPEGSTISALSSSLSSSSSSSSSDEDRRESQLRVPKTPVCVCGGVCLTFIQIWRASALSRVGKLGEENTHEFRANTWAELQSAAHALLPSQRRAALLWPGPPGAPPGSTCTRRRATGSGERSQN